MIGDSQKGGLKDLLRNRLRIFLNLKKINIKLLNEKKLKELKKLKLKKKKEKEIINYFLIKEETKKKTKASKIPVMYKEWLEYHEISRGYAGNVVYSNDGEILAHIIYDSNGRAILECSSKEKFNKLIKNQNNNLSHYSKIVIKDNKKSTTIKPNEINGEFDINKVLFQNNIIESKPIDIILENEFVESRNKVDNNEVNNKKDNLLIPKIVAGVCLYSTIKLVDNLLEKNNEKQKENKSNNKEINDNKDNIIDKKEFSKEENEILKIVSKFITESTDEIKKMRLELDELDKKVDEEYDKEKLQELHKKYLELKEKIENLKRKFDVIKKNTNFMDFNELDDSILWDKIDDYKFTSNNDDIEALARECKKELEKMEKIIILYEDSEKLDKKVDDKEEEIQKRDELFKEKDKDLKLIEAIDNKVKYNLDIQEKFLKELENKVSKVSFEEKIDYQTKGYDKLLANIVRMTFGFVTLPFSGRYGSIALGSILVNNAIKGLKNSLHTEEHKTLYITYTDYAKQIKNHSDKLDLASNLIVDSLDDLKKIKKTYKESFEEYRYKIPEYDKMIKRIEKIEDNLTRKQKQIDEYKYSLQKKAQKNKDKVKKIEARKLRYEQNKK